MLSLLTFPIGYFHAACVILLVPVSQSGWYGDHFVVGDVGKRMEGALAPLWEQAWGNGPLRSPYIYTHIDPDTEIRVDVQLWAQCLQCFYVIFILGVVELDVGRWPNPTWTPNSFVRFFKKQMYIHSLYVCESVWVCVAACKSKRVEGLVLLPNRNLSLEKWTRFGA